MAILLNIGIILVLFHLVVTILIHGPITAITMMAIIAAGTINKPEIIIVIAGIAILIVLLHRKIAEVIAGITVITMLIIGSNIPANAMKTVHAVQDLKMLCAAPAEFPDLGERAVQQMVVLVRVRVVLITHILVPVHLVAEQLPVHIVVA